MINAKELRIGNYVLDLKRIGEVSSVSKSRVRLRMDNSIVIIDSQLQDNDKMELEIDPITINNDWLNKLGFRKYVSMWQDPFVTYWVMETKAGFGIGFRHKKSITSLVTSIKYVHELQNLHYSLTGRELKVT